MAVSLPRTRWLVTAMLVAAVVALVLATRAPLTVTVLGLIAFGVLHNVLEIRYVAGRFATVLTGRFLLLLLLLCSGIAACRVLAPAWPQGSRYAEVVIGYLILLAGCALGLRGLRLVAGTVTLAVAAYASLSYPAYHFVVLTHLHYVVWVGFLARFAPDAAAAFDARVPWLRGRRAWVVGIVGGGFLAVLFVSDYFQGRALYGALATYHAYLEFPVLLALLLSPLTLSGSVRERADVRERR